MWTIFNLSVLKDIIKVFLLYISFKLTWSATDRQLVGDQSPTGRRPVASSRKDVPTRSPISRQPVPDADQLQNLVATPLRPLRSF